MGRHRLVVTQVGERTTTGSGRSVIFWYGANCPRLAWLAIAPETAPAVPEPRQEEAAAYRLQGQFQDPSMWWPEDRAWVAASDVESDAMYVAGSHVVLAELLRADLEAHEVTPDDAMTIEE